ncbi:hypothetical protein GCM10008957_45310 [Deinococcus ruber]|uniref:Polysaccharide biosynthesis protein C-terminal domain-containing protein n=2 Tax=Deinococcus ruber TaxID=1848197 RepID=A0A918FD98_9DEIO|nr:hypothetical protein GCM10008957_45310 [Deinococcus ruber]
MVWVRRELGWGTLSLRPILAEIKAGGAFSISLSAQSIYNDIDKTMLARMVSSEAAGVYAAAYRIIDVAFTPVRAVLYASYAKFFQHGEQGIKSNLRYAMTLLPWATLYSGIIGVFLFFIAPVLPIMFGKDFEASVNVLRWLAPLILLKSIHSFLADTLTGANYQFTRSIIQAVVAFFNVALNFAILSRFSIKGAIFSSIISDFLLLSLLIIASLRITRSFNE